MRKQPSSLHTRLGRSILHGCAIVVLGASPGACMISDGQDRTADREPAAQSQPPQVDTVELTQPGATPSVVFVYECSLNGLWYATRDLCKAHCAGGFCITCGVDCQN